jgi:hypothetical protein
MKKLIISLFLFTNLAHPSDLILKDAEKVECEEDTISFYNAHLIWRDTELSAEKVVLEEGEGMQIEDAHIFVEDWRIFGESILARREKMEIERGWFTTCASEDPHYIISSDRITLSSKKIKASNIFFKIKDVPIFYIPFYSYSIREPSSPYSVRLGVDDRAGIFLKTSYNYHSEIGRHQALLDYYQKRGLGVGMRFEGEESGCMAYCIKERRGSLRWQIEGAVKKRLLGFDGRIEVESSSDNRVDVHYFRKVPRCELRSYGLIESRGKDSIFRIVVEERRVWKNGRFGLSEKHIPSISLSLFPQSSKDWVWDIELYTDRKGEGFDASFEGRVGRGFRIWNISFLHTLLKRAEYVEDKPDLSISSILNTRIWPVRWLKLDIENRVTHSFEKKSFSEKELSILLSVNSKSCYAKVEAGFDLMNRESDLMAEAKVYLGKGVSLFFDGVYTRERCLKTEARASFLGKRKAFELSVVRKDKVVIRPSFKIALSNKTSFWIDGYYQEDELREIEGGVSTLLHCFKTSLSLRYVKQDIGIGVDIGIE